MELVTGRAGTPHITSQQDRQRNQGTFGDGAYILKTGNQLDPVVQSSNKIQIKDGALMFQGALFSVKVGTVDEVTIANGSQGMQRKDLIVARYTYDAGENVESAAWAVIQGTPAASNPVTPEYTEGDIQAGDTTVECPVFIVTLDGINITGVEMVPEIAPDVPEIMAQLEELNSNNIWGERQIIGQSIGLTVFFRRNAYMYQVEVGGSINGSSVPLGGKKLANLPEGITTPQSTHRYMSTDSRLSIQINTDGEIWLYSTSNISSTSSGINVAVTEPILS
ncbi:hypothetical protein [Waltera sp.]|uniref:hypothetical protein n=1 Tax=Waltera sp. TaxID=2815806 RepID=UPI003AB27B64